MAMMPKWSRRSCSESAPARVNPDELRTRIRRNRAREQSGPSPPHAFLQAAIESHGHRPGEHQEPRGAEVAEIADGELPRRVEDEAAVLTRFQIELK
jgi:hypothetical protein